MKRIHQLTPILELSELLTELKRVPVAGITIAEKAQAIRFYKKLVASTFYFFE